MPINKKMLVSRPSTCRFCLGVFKGMAHINAYAEQQGMTVISIDGKDAVDGTVVDAITNQDPILFFGFGHGLPYLFTGDNEFTIYDINNVDNLSERVVYLLSCLTAQQLGPRILDKGGRTFTGYQWDFTWLAEDVNQDVTIDYAAQGFYDCAFQIIRSLIDGKTIQQAHEDSYNRYDHWISIWENERQNDPDSAEAIKWLLFDQDILRTMGDGSATINDPAATTSNLTGTIADAVTQNPIMGASVTVGDMSDVSDEDGHFRIEFPSGIYMIAVRAQGYIGIEFQEDMTAPANYGLNAYLEPGEDPPGESVGLFEFGTIAGGLMLWGFL